MIPIINSLRSRATSLRYEYFQWSHDSQSDGNPSLVKGRSGRGDNKIPDSNTVTH